MDEQPTWSKERRDALTPDEVLELLRVGNERFASGDRHERDYVAEQRATAAGQWPAAVVLGCIDSRVPVEILFDVGIGHVFTARVAGNVVNQDVLGSLEFACAVAGAKLVCVLGHTDCGAIKGAVSRAGDGNLRALLRRIEPAVERAAGSRPRDPADDRLVADIARANVADSVEDIRRQSATLRELDERGAIRVVGAVYDVAAGRVEFF